MTQEEEGLVLEDGTILKEGGTVFVKRHVNISGVGHNTPIEVAKLFYHKKDTPDPCIWIKGTTGAISLVRKKDVFNAQMPLDKQ